MTQVTTAILFSFCTLIAAELIERDCVKVATDNGVKSRLCVGRPRVVEVGQNTSMDITMSWDSNVTISICLDIHVEHQHIAKFPPQITIQNGSGELVFLGVKAGKSIISFKCENNSTEDHLNSSCPLSDELLDFLKREVSFVNSLLLDVITFAVGWTYTIFWVLSYYPQKYYSCKRGSVAGFNFSFVGLLFTATTAYFIFNISLFWIPQVQEGYCSLADCVFVCYRSRDLSSIICVHACKNEYFKRHPEGVNPVQLNDVAYSICALLSLIIWVCQCLILKREGQKIGFVGVLFIVLLWLLILSCVIMGAVGFLVWLDSLYIISYTTIIAAIVKYIPMIWSNFRRKSTEGFSPYTTILSLVGGLFSVIQMFLLAYNYDDWKSIFGDPTKFGIGVITVGFEVIHFVQHYIIYRRAWMKKYKLPIECTCDPGCCKCKITITRRRSSIKVCDTVALPYEKLELKSIVYL